MKRKDNGNEDLKARRLEVYSIGGSVGVHLLILLSFVILARISGGYYSASGGVGGYYDISPVRGIPPAAGEAAEASREKEKAAGEVIHEKKTRVARTVRETKEETLPEKKSDIKPHGETTLSSSNDNAGSRGTSGGYRSIEAAGFDSSGLGQVYQESTLKVRLRYPFGWVFVDQQRKKKLDGITFWAGGGNYNPPPYIHVEVVEKYLFNPEQYRHRYDFDGFTGYYNDPQEMENQVSQTIYIRTGDDEDYSIKLIMNGKEAFNQFQPVFFAMVRSFRFGSSFF
ncbi:MAG: hypothetical protein ACM3S2_01655 [Ignavibacteriales bacterium]